MFAHRLRAYPLSRSSSLKPEEFRIHVPARGRTTSGRAKASTAQKRQAFVPTSRASCATRAGFPTRVPGGTDWLAGLMTRALSQLHPLNSLKADRITLTGTTQLALAVSRSVPCATRLIPPPRVCSSPPYPTERRVRRSHARADGTTHAKIAYDG